jgi:hypothetical protein
MESCLAKSMLSKISRGLRQIYATIRSSRGFDFTEGTAVFGVHHNVTFERIWAKESKGWKLLIYQKTPNRSVRKAMRASNHGRAADCNNPCTNIPFGPVNASERELINAAPAMSITDSNYDATAWAVLVRDDMLPAIHIGGVPFTKKGRIAEIARDRTAHLPCQTIPGFLVVLLFAGQWQL